MNHHNHRYCRCRCFGGTHRWHTWGPRLLRCWDCPAIFDGVLL